MQNASQEMQTQIVISVRYLSKKIINLDRYENKRCIIT